MFDKLSRAERAEVRALGVVARIAARGKPDPIPDPKMCKHISSTVVNATLEDGTPLRIYQCDMCGLLLPKRDVEEGADSMEMDWQALQVGLDRIWAPLFKEMK